MFSRDVGRSPSFNLAIDRLLILKILKWRATISKTAALIQDETIYKLSEKNTVNVCHITIANF